MLKQYRRHTNQCVKGYKQHDRKQANCKCMVYVEGRLTRTSPYIKESTGTRSWEEARGRLKAFSAERGIIHLSELALHDLLAFKQTWPTGARATVNNIQRLRSFFSFCVGLRWVEESPAKKLTMPKGIKGTQKLLFSSEEMSRIVNAAQIISLHRKSTITNLDLFAFILTMRYTGLRISDCGLLLSSRLQVNSIFLYAQKNGAPVYCPLLPWVANVLRSVPVKPGGYLFCAGSTRLETVV